MASDPIKSAYRHTWWALVLRGLLSIAVGVFIFWRPVDSVASFALVIAIWALFSGIVQVVHAFDLRVVYSRWWAMLLGGLVSVGFGIAAFYYYPILSLAFAVVWVGWWLLLSGGLGIYVAIEEKRLGVPWGWTMAFALAGVVVGVLALLNPPITLAAIMGVLAAFALVTGVLNLVGAYKLASFKEDIAAALRPAGQH
jgi:uncharacterized membrane protein HdeD (DUF308 family)